jgi:hypothetical protein
VIEEDRPAASDGVDPAHAAKFAFQPVLGSAFSKRLYALTSNLNGGRRAMVPIGTFEELMPQDFLPTQLLRALLVMDTDQAQALGRWNWMKKTLGLVGFACPAKYEYGHRPARLPDQDRKGGLGRWVCATSSTASSRISSRAGMRTLFPIYEMVESFLYTPKTVTTVAPHARSYIDMKRIMTYVVIATIPCILVALYNTGLSGQFRHCHMGRRAGAHGSLALGIGFNPANPLAKYPARAALFPADLHHDAGRADSSK